MVDSTGLLATFLRYQALSWCREGSREGEEGRCPLTVGLPVGQALVSPAPLSPAKSPPLPEHSLCLNVDTSLSPSTPKEARIRERTH